LKLPSKARNKMLSYRRETALQDALLVLAKSGKVKLRDKILRLL